jgi:hypothetical protein
VSTPARTAFPPRLRQPVLGLAGLILIAAIVVLVGVLPSPERVPLQVLGPILIFWFPILLGLAFSQLARTGQDPEARGNRALTGLVTALASLAAAVVLTAVAQLIVGKLDLNGMFSTVDSANPETFTTFPFTLVLGLLVVVAMLQITLLWGAWPVRSLRPQAAGWAALGLSWLIALVVYFFIVNWNSVPADVRSAIGLRNPGGPWDGPDFLALLFTVMLWQVVFGVLFEGEPFASFRSTGARVWASSAWMVVLGAVTFLIWRHGVHFPNGAVVGIGGAGLASVFVMDPLLGRWPFHRERPGIARFGLLVTALVGTPSVYFFLRATGNETATPPVGLWIGVCGLGYIGALVVMHVLVWRRWPLPAEEQPLTGREVGVDPER